MAVLVYEQKNDRCFVLPSARSRWTLQTEENIKTKVLMHILSFFRSCEHREKSNAHGRWRRTSFCRSHKNSVVSRGCPYFPHATGGMHWQFLLPKECVYSYFCKRNLGSEGQIPRDLWWVLFVWLLFSVIFHQEFVSLSWR